MLQYMSQSNSPKQVSPRGSASPTHPHPQISITSSPNPNAYEIRREESDKRITEALKNETDLNHTITEKLKPARKIQSQRKPSSKRMPKIKNDSISLIKEQYKNISEVSGERQSQVLNSS